MSTSPAAVCPGCGTRLAWRHGADYCIPCSSPKESTPPMPTSIEALDIAIAHLINTGPIINGANAFEPAVETLVALRELIAEGQS